jgi:fatty acid desaturase
MAHHRQEFGPDEPDIPLYAGYPISPASFRRKMVRDATGQTGFRLFREQFAGFRSSDARVLHTLWKILLVQAVLFGAAIVGGVWWVYPVFWVLPYLTVWRVINRLRAIAEHGGMDASSDRRATTHAVCQSWSARAFLVPFHIGWHLAHHVDPGVSMRHLPEYHRALREAGYVTPGLEFPTYRALWRALRDRQRAEKPAGNQAAETSST